LHLEVKFKATGSEFAPQLQPDGSADRTAYFGARLLCDKVTVQETTGHRGTLTPKKFVASIWTFLKVQIGANLFFVMSDDLTPKRSC
jgi:hypothetical protein